MVLRLLFATLIVGPAALAQPDAAISNLVDPHKWGPSTPPGSATYSIGGSTCNLGTAPLQFGSPSSPNHPIFVQQVFRLHNGRFEQIGLSFAFHEFCPLQQGACGTCTPHPDCTALGVGCSSPDTSTIAGNFGSLGRRSQVNPLTGAYAFPYAQPIGTFPGGRIHIANDDLDPALYPGARFFSELLIVAPDDAAAGNGLNNASHRELLVGSFVNNGWNLANAPGPVFMHEPALAAWERLAPAGAVKVIPVDIPGEGRLFVASSAIYDGPRAWRYEYAVYNLNSDRAVGSFTVPVVPNLFIGITGTAFRGVEWHSGEVWSSDPWTVTHYVGDATDWWQWATEPFATNPSASAIRWGTLFNFTLYSDSPPRNGDVLLGLFKPGTPEAISAEALVPDQPCLADFDRNGVREVPDIFLFLQYWFAGDPAADFNGVGGIGVPDIFAFLAAWFAGC